MFQIGLTHYLALSVLLFCIGLAVMALKRNAVGILIGAELLLNAANLNFAAAGRYRAGGSDGQLAAVFVVALAAAGAAVALAIVLNYYSSHATVDVDEGRSLRA